MLSTAGASLTKGDLLLEDFKTTPTAWVTPGHHLHSFL